MEVFLMFSTHETLSQISVTILFLAQRGHNHAPEEDLCKTVELIGARSIARREMPTNLAEQCSEHRSTSPFAETSESVEAFSYTGLPESARATWALNHSTHYFRA